MVDVKDKTMCRLKLEPMKLPTFKGDIRAYHQCFSASVLHMY